jgi:M6 family metalloprotease-like protein
MPSSVARVLPAGRHIVLAVVVLIGILLIPCTLGAAWLDLVPVTILQPDGTRFQCYASGDEFHNWLHDARGYTIIQHPHTGVYVFAALEGETLVPTSLVAGRDEPVGLQPWMNISPRAVMEIRARRTDAASIDEIAAPPMGVLNNIVIFIRFADDPEFTDALSGYTTMFNSSAAGTSSLYNYYKESSYNQLTITSTFYPTPTGMTVASYQDSHPRGYYKPRNDSTNQIGYTTDRTQREHALLHATLLAIKGQLPPSLVLDSNNDGRVDNVCFVIKGTNTGWSELLWPHMWSLYTYSDSLNGKRVYNYNFQIQSMMSASVLCHEMGHTLGAPDLYRYTNTSMTPVGSWDLMSNNTTPPQQMGVHVKVRYMRWLPALPIIKTPGRYTLRPLTTSTQNGYRITSPYITTQYFVVEYRKKTSIFEQANEGLVVYRIDSIRSGNANGPPDEIYVYRPGGDTNKTGDIAKAAFSLDANRTVINDWADPSPFLANRAPGGLFISDIGLRGDSISFTLHAPLAAAIDSLGALGMGDSVVIGWRSAAEYRLKSFDVQRAVTDTTVFASINVQPIRGAGTSTTRHSYRFTDRAPGSRRYYRIAVTDSSNNTNYTRFFLPTGTVGVAPEAAPFAFALEQNYPNPFNPTTALSYQLSAVSKTKITIYDMLGREVAVLVNETKGPGRYSVEWDARRNASGFYICRMVAGDYVGTRKLVLVK